jgi:hypothetical protein
MICQILHYLMALTPLHACIYSSNAHGDVRALFYNAHGDGHYQCWVSIIIL